MWKNGISNPRHSRNFTKLKLITKTNVRHIWHTRTKICAHYAMLAYSVSNDMKVWLYENSHTLCSIGSTLTQAHWTHTKYGPQSVLASSGHGCWNCSSALCPLLSNAWSGLISIWLLRQQRGETDAREILQDSSWNIIKMPSDSSCCCTTTLYTAF